MRKFIFFTMISLMPITAMAMTSNELAENTKPEQSIRSQEIDKQVQVTRLVLPEMTLASEQNFVNKIVRSFGSDSSKMVTLIWSNNTAKLSAEKVQKQLLQRKIPKEKIKLTQSRMKRDIYPVYAEIMYLGVKPSNCKNDTAEDMMSFDPNDFCRSKSNFKTQLKY